MLTAHDLCGAVHRGATATLLARVVDDGGAPLGPAGIASASYSIEELSDASATSPVAGHQAIDLEADDVLFATLQNDDHWLVDELGYNFRHRIDVTDAPAFPTSGNRCLVRYELRDADGQPVVFRFRLEVL
ncbi:hypothetical protein [Botrimarina sp.]|uniref:hypothetical protein n=1 Tax=Botrimarina sp. TaxID=2795802 RepID=UPI0032EFEA08